MRLVHDAAATFERLGALRALARARAALAGLSADAVAAEPLGSLTPLEDVPVPAGPRRGFADVP